MRILYYWKNRTFTRVVLLEILFNTFTTSLHHRMTHFQTLFKTKLPWQLLAVIQNLYVCYVSMSFWALAGAWTLMLKVSLFVFLVKANTSKKSRDTLTQLCFSIMCASICILISYSHQPKEEKCSYQWWCKCSSMDCTSFSFSITDYWSCSWWRRIWVCITADIMLSISTWTAEFSETKILKDSITNVTFTTLINGRLYLMFWHYKNYMFLKIYLATSMVHTR